MTTKSFLRYLSIFLMALICSVCVFAGVNSQELAELNSLRAKRAEKLKLVLPDRAGDSVFIRRIYLDLLGRIPSLAETKKFLEDKHPDKREKIIAKLLNSEDYAQVTAMWLGDLLRIKSEFPINLWPNAVQLYHRYLWTAAKQDRSWRQVAKELLTSNGSNFRVAPANFFRAVASRNPEGLASATVLTFCGWRFERLSDKQKQDLTKIFSGIKFKSTDEWKEEIVYDVPEALCFTTVMPDGSELVVDSNKCLPRECFANWLLATDNAYFAAAMANRLWQRLFGSGILQPIDDLPYDNENWLKKGEFPDWFKEKNEKIDIDLMRFLAEAFKKHDFKFRPFLELILNSDYYQSTWNTAQQEQTLAEKNFIVYPVHRIGAEMILDSISMITQVHERYRSVIPEPFTILPADYPAVKIADGSISSAALDNFGRPPRDSGKSDERHNEVKSSQRLWLMNSGVLYRQFGNRVKKLRQESGKSWRYPDNVNLLYLMVLSRYATDDEVQIVKNYIDGHSVKRRMEAWNGVLWSLVNTKEFLYQH